MCLSLDALLTDWNGETLVVRRDAPSGAWIFVAVHSTQLGPSAGGTRMKTYGRLEDAAQDALRLSAAMTLKFAVPRIARGGGKAVIHIPAALAPEERRGVLLRYGALVQSLGGQFSTGPDVGTSADDMNVIAETAAPYVFGRTPSAGGAGASGPATALGVFTGIEVACERVFGTASLAGRRVLVQGMGSVGTALAVRLDAAGAEVLYHDTDEAAVAAARDLPFATFVPADAVYGTACDVFAPCALGGTLNAASIPRLNCRAVVGGANNQLGAPDDAERLRARGILYAPDYVVNVGGAMAIPGMEQDGWSLEEADEAVRDRVRAALRQVFEDAESSGTTPETAARRLAATHLAGAGSPQETDATRSMTAQTRNGHP